MPSPGPEPFYFGDRRALFGAHHRAARTRGGVVLCYPLGREYIRAHRACHRLATKLCLTGIDVLRFDYSGTGDSAGEAPDALETWLADVALAIGELRRRTGLPKVTVAGLRFGAAVAYLAAKGREDVERILLWEPVLEGRAQEEKGLAGFRFAPRFLDDVARVDLLTLPAADRDVLFVEEGDGPRFWGEDEKALVPGPAIERIVASVAGVRR